MRLLTLVKHPFKNAGWYALILGLVAALVVLAVLQYHSSRQLSDATSEQMHATLDASLMDLRRGVENELSLICRDLELGSQGQWQDDLEQLASRFADWRRTAPHTTLVANVFVWRSGGRVNSGMLQLDMGRDEFVPAQWPSQLDRLRMRLEEMSGNHPGPTDFVADTQHRPPQTAPPPPPPDARHVSPWLVDVHVPALVHADVTSSWVPNHDGRPRTITWVIVQLDSDVLAKHIFPELAQRYFGGSSGLVYRVAVLSGIEGQAPIYSSEAALEHDFVPDASLNMFGPPFAPGMNSATRMGPVVLQAPPSQVQLKFGQRNEGTVTESDSGGPPPGFEPRADDPGLRGSLFAVKASPAFPPSHREPFMLECIHYTPSERGWVIVAQHRKGSLEAAVSSIFYRNLAINFGVLLVLALTTLLIIVTSVRARRLAQLQVDFVAGVSHEFRTPLTGILAAAQNISDGLVESKDQLKRYGSAILHQTQQLSDLIEQILMFSAVEKGRQRYHPQLADVAQVLDASLKNMESLINSSGVTVERCIEPGLPPVNTDVKALSRCLDNLITNAIKYAGEERWVRVHAFSADSSEHRKEVCVSVEDHGIGIDSADLKLIFEPFYRSPAVTAAQIHGNGLGLPLAKKIAEAMGGRLSVQSVPGKGSSFTIHLPAKERVGDQQHLVTTPP
jgi:signal transduction histidine kinase